MSDMENFRTVLVLMQVDAEHSVYNPKSYFSVTFCISCSDLQSEVAKDIGLHKHLFHRYITGLRSMTCMLTLALQTEKNRSPLYLACNGFMQY